MTGTQQLIVGILTVFGSVFGALCAAWAMLRSKDKEKEVKEREQESAWDQKVLEEGAKIREYYATNEAKLLARIDKLDEVVSHLREQDTQSQNLIVSLRNDISLQRETAIRKDEQIAELSRLNGAQAERIKALLKRETELYAQVKLLTQENVRMANKQRELEARVQAHDEILSDPSSVNGAPEPVKE